MYKRHIPHMLLMLVVYNPRKNAQQPKSQLTATREQVAILGRGSTQPRKHCTRSASSNMGTRGEEREKTNLRKLVCPADVDEALLGAGGSALESDSESACAESCCCWRSCDDEDGRGGSWPADMSTSMVPRLGCAQAAR